MAGKKDTSKEPNELNQVGLEPATDDSNSSTASESPQIVESDALSANPEEQPADTAPVAIKDTIEEDEPAPLDKKTRRKLLLGRLRSHINIYISLFFVILIIVLIIVVFVFRNTQWQIQNQSFSGSSLDEAAAKNLKGSESKIGDSKTLLTIESSTIFSGKVLVRDAMEVAGKVTFGSPVTLPGITVTGTTALDQTTINNLQVSGNATVTGQLTAQRGLAVTGTTTLGGNVTANTITAQQLNLTQDLNLGRHIVTSGRTPGVSGGTAIGSGGTVSISGNDSSGSVAVNTGSGTVAGVLANITFTAAYGSTPHVVISPVGSGAAALNYYVTRTTNGFTIATTNAPSPGVSFNFDYIVVN